MSNVMKLAEAVAAELAAFGAEVQFVPEFTAAESRALRAAVVPAGTEFRALSRNVHAERPCIHVGFVRKATEDDVPELVDTVQTAAQSFLNRRLCGMTCTGVVFDPLYSPAHLREKGVFLGVAELTFEGTG